VWEKGGKKLFEKVNKSQVKVWCSSSGNTVVYKPAPGDEDSDCIYIVHVKNNYIQRVRDTLNDPSYRNIYFNNSILFLGNETHIKYWEIPSVQFTQGSGVSDVFEVQNDRICTYTPGKKIHFFFGTNLMFAYEMEDGQLSCATFTPKNVDPANPQFDSDEVTDYVPRNVENDPITKCFVMRKEIFFMMALRKSGHVDIYTNMQRFHTTPEKCSDIFHDGYNIYFKEAETAKIKYIICSKERVSQWVKTRDILPSFNEDHIMHKRTSEHLKFPAGFCLYQNTLFVAFGKMVHQFSILFNQWISH
jgi:hypothetical protein